MLHSGFSQVICNRWIDETRGSHCVLEKGHDGPCLEPTAEDCERSATAHDAADECDA